VRWVLEICLNRIIRCLRTQRLCHGKEEKNPSA
jgi:hypothetical protein